MTPFAQARSARRSAGAPVADAGPLPGLLRLELAVLRRGGGHEHVEQVPWEIIALLPQGDTLTQDGALVTAY